MELYSMDGILKDSTECAPNGYYFFVYDNKGTFRIEIKGPEGWTFGNASSIPYRFYDDSRFSRS